MSVVVSLNGCDDWLDGLLWWNWKQCCDVHDFAYAMGGTWLDRLRADMGLGSCVSQVLLPMGLIMFVGVAVAGWLFFRFRRIDPGAIEDVIYNLSRGDKVMVMSASLRLLQFIGGHEGKVLSWYLDPTGTPTIGYGFTWGSKIFQNWWMSHRGQKLKRGDTMTEAEALEVLKLMVEGEYMPPVERKFPGAKINEKEGSTSLVFNAGPGALNWSWATALAKGDVAGAAKLIRTTATTSKGKKLPGLVIRRQEEADIVGANKWPSWVNSTALTKPPETHLTDADVRQAQSWLAELGYYKSDIDGIAGGKTKLAVSQFQQDHGTLRVDGIIGPATLSALQRTIDLKKKAGTAAGGGAVVVAGGVTEKTTGAGDTLTVPGTNEHMTWLGDVLLWGGVVVALGVIIYFAWRYRDEIHALLRRL